MRALALLAEVRAAGIDVSVDGDELVLSGQTGNLSPSLLQTLRVMKSDLLAAAGSGQLPFLDANGDLHIPHDAPLRYRWWAGGQTIADTLAELGASPEVGQRYTTAPSAFSTQPSVGAPSASTPDTRGSDHLAGVQLPPESETDRDGFVVGKPKR